VSRSALAAGLAAVGLWGLAPVATRAAVGHLSPLPLLTIRMAAASLILLPWALSACRGLASRQAGRLAAAGLLGLVGYNLPVAVGLRWLPASTAGLLLATEPVWVLLLGRVFLAERGGARPWIGSAVALAGVAVLAVSQQALSQQAVSQHAVSQQAVPAQAVPGVLAAGAGGYRAAAGMAAVLAGTVAFAGYTIVLRPLSQALGAVPATAASTVAGTLPYLAFSGTLAGAGLGRLDAAAWAEIAFLAAGSTAAGMLLWNVAVLAGGASRVSLLLYLEPVVAVVGAAVFLGERPGPPVIGAGLLILAGVAVASSSAATGSTGEATAAGTAEAPENQR
jgi:drug/metabolite transporter (DMT)-like permease